MQQKNIFQVMHPSLEQLFCYWCVTIWYQILKLDSHCSVLLLFCRSCWVFRELYGQVRHSWVVWWQTLKLHMLQLLASCTTVAPHHLSFHTEVLFRTSIQACRQLQVANSEMLYVMQLNYLNYLYLLFDYGFSTNMSEIGWVWMFSSLVPYFPHRTPCWPAKSGGSNSWYA